MILRTVACAAIVVVSGYAVADVASSRGTQYETPAPGSVVHDVTYSTTSNQKLDIYYPSTPGPHPVIVWLHGGGWIAGSKAEGLPDYLERQLERRNFVGVAIDYRLAGWTPDGAPVDPFPAALHDVKTAVRFLKAHDDEYDLESNEILLAGVSAGGHLAALAGTSASLGLIEPDSLPPDLGAVDSTVRGVIDVVGISDVEAWSQLGSVWAREPVAAFLGCPRWTSGPVDCPADAYARASVATYVSVVAPPAFLAYATQDELVPPAEQGVPLYWQWTAAKGAENVYYDESATQGHDLDGSGIDTDRLEQFIDAVLAGTIN